MNSAVWNVIALAGLVQSGSRRIILDENDQDVDDASGCLPAGSPVAPLDNRPKAVTINR
jgi:hypothetical protein